MPRRALAIIAVLILAAAACSALPRVAARAEGRARYIVELAPAPGLAEAQDGESSVLAALDAVAAATEAPAVPAYVYTRALRGFALDLAPAEAAAVAALPDVVRVVPDWTYELATDAGPAFIGAAQADLRPAIFYARLSGARAVPPATTSATGRAVAAYDAATRALRFQVFYVGLSGPPTGAVIAKGGAGEAGSVVSSLATAAVGTPGTAGGYIGVVTLDTTAADALFQGKLYINIATASAPGGELREQLGASRGAGEVIGVLDTGIDPAHPSFSSAPADGHTYANPLGRRLGVCDQGNAGYDAGFCNNKLIGAYTFADTAGTPDPQGRPSPRDNYGHGSHVASIAAGNIVPGAAIGGATLGTVSGVAPHANLVAYDVCGIPGNAGACSGAALLEGIDQAIADGVDVLNLSLSGSSRDPWAAADARALLRATGAGIAVVASAGNKGPAASTTGAPANAPWVTSVASVSHGRSTVNGVRVTDAVAANRLDASSARGPDLSVPDLLKPEVAAPGVNILAAWANVDDKVTDWAELSGTSMAAPHIAGLTALLREIHPDWTPAELRSAIVLTGAATKDQNGAPADLFAQGGGRAVAGSAALAGFVLDADEAAYRAADPAAGGDPSTLNLPALVSQRCVGACAFTRTLRSAVGVPLTWDIAGGGDGFTITSAPAGPLTLAPGASATVTITAAVTAPRDGALGYGAVTFTARGGLAPVATMPVAIPLDSSDLPAAITAAAAPPSGTRAVTVRAIAIGDLAVAAHGLARLQPAALSLAQDPTPDNYADGGAGGIYQEVVILPVGNARFTAVVDQASASELSLILYQDQAGAGAGSLGPEDSILCRHTGAGSEARCDVVAPDPVAGRAQAVAVTVLVQNHKGSGRAQDSLRLLRGQVSAGTGVGNLSVTGPRAVAAGSPFALTVGWALPGASAGDRYIGVVSLGSKPASAGDLGTALIDLTIGPHQSFLPLLQR